MAQTGLIRGRVQTLAALLLNSAVLMGCATAPSSPTSTAAIPAPAGAKAPAPVGPLARAALDVQTHQVPVPPPWPAGPRDTCGAGGLTWLVGHARTDIPVPVDLSRRRVACTACPVAPDVRLDRLNILYDAQTGQVVRLTCG